MTALVDDLLALGPKGLPPIVRCPNCGAPWHGLAHDRCPGSHVHGPTRPANLLAPVDDW